MLTSKYLQQGCVGLIGLLLSATALAWNDIYFLPNPDAPFKEQYFPAVQANAAGTATSRLLYSDNSTNNAFLMPVFSVSQGRTLRINIIVPPGVARLSFSGKSNDWQGVSDGRGGFVPGTYPIMAGYNEEPGEFCTLPKRASGGTELCGDVAGNFVFTEDLAPAGGGLNLSFTVENNDGINESYVYFVLYHQPSTTTSFEFATLTLLYVIEDINAYNNWRNRRILGGVGVDVDNNDGNDSSDTPITPPDTGNPTVPDFGNPTTIVPDTTTTLPLVPLIFGHPNTTETAAMVNMRGIIRNNTSNQTRDVTRNALLDEGEYFALEAEVTPETAHGPTVDMVLIAAWFDATNHRELLQGPNSALWFQKQVTSGFFANQETLVWTPWEGPGVVPNSSDLLIENLYPYAKQVPVTGQPYKMVFGSGNIQPPAELDVLGRRVEIYAGYLGKTADGQDFLVVGEGLRLNIDSR